MIFVRSRSGLRMALQALREEDDRQHDKHYEQDPEHFQHLPAVACTTTLLLTGVRQRATVAPMVSASAKVTLTVRITPEVDEWLREQAATQERSMGWLVEQGLKKLKDEQRTKTGRAS